MLRPLLLYPDSHLSQPAKEVTRFGEDSLGWILKDLVDCMNTYGGAGLAANQLGNPHRICIIADEGMDKIFINPHIIKMDGLALSTDEGCLSIPGLVVKLPCRRELVEVSAQDIDGIAFRYTAVDMAALKLQHEIDHLDGLTIFDKMSYAKRCLLKKKYFKDSKRFQYAKQLEAFVKHMRDNNAITDESNPTSITASDASLSTSTG